MANGFFELISLTTKNRMQRMQHRIRIVLTLALYMNPGSGVWKDPTK